MEEYNLSYVLTTRNKLHYLREVLSRLIRERKSDEEIVVIDGASTDGTVNYLRELLRTGQIQQLKSEPDRGEAHGINKGLLMAKGELIKLVTDDDAFYWTGIQTCKDFMLTHPEIDLLGANVANTHVETSRSIDVVTEFQVNYLNWLKNQRSSFFFNGLSLFLRKSQLPLTGLFHTGCLLVDFEFSLRVTPLINLAWYTSVLAVRIDSPQSNYRRYSSIATEERLRISNFYSRDDLFINKNSRKTNIISGLITKIMGYVKIVKGFTRDNKIDKSKAATCLDASSVHFAFQTCHDWLNDYNGRNKGEFIFNADARSDG